MGLDLSMVKFFMCMMWSCCNECCLICECSGCDKGRLVLKDTPLCLAILSCKWRPVWPMYEALQLPHVYLYTTEDLHNTGRVSLILKKVFIVIGLCGISVGFDCGMCL